ncbi:MAG: hypothetical protein MJZ72_00530 [Bacteroidales bacterium]|nr:hypothetical protein [Bacteroidales bacterium]
MKNRNAIIVSLLALVMTLNMTSCKPDINITSDYKETTVVYALLNPNDNYQYLKIYKGYLTKENALVWAQNLDNISYYNDIEVKLHEYIEDRYIRTIKLDTVMSIAKNYGEFSSPTQVLYRVKDRIKDGYRYKLNVINKISHDTVYSELSTIKNMCFNIPLGSVGSKSTINLNFQDSWPVGFRTNTIPENASAIDVYLTFKYIEKNKQTGEVSHKSIDNVRLSPGFCYGNQVTFEPYSIYQIIQKNIPVNDNVWRYPDTYECIQLTLWACDETYYQYYKVSQPSSTIVQDRIKYTNLFSAQGNNVLGFFAARTSVTRTFGIDIVNNNEDSLVSGCYTRNLNFRRYDEFEE